jgi:RNA recognition motif-containing protein
LAVRLFIGNLPYNTTDVELREHFGAVAPPLQIVMPVDRETGRPRGFAFVDFSDRSAAEEAIRRFDGQPFKGRTLAVSEARAREDRGPVSRPPGAFAPRPPSSAEPGAPAGARSARTFGPDAPSRRQRQTRRAKSERGPKGPIRERTTGRVYAVDDDEAELEVEFEDVATSVQGEIEEDES